MLKITLKAIFLSYGGCPNKCFVLQYTLINMVRGVTKVAYT